MTIHSKLIALSLGLVVVPGAVFGYLAASNATAALERAVGRELATVARQAARELDGAVDEQRARVGSWAGQELMREIVVGDVDKRISRFLVGERGAAPMLLDALVTDRGGRVVAAADPALIDTVPADDVAATVPASGDGSVVAGPRPSTRHGRDVVEIAIAVADPDDPATRIGTVHAIYDWRLVGAALDRVRADAATLGIALELLVIDDGGRLVGGAWDARSGLRPGDDVGFAARDEAADAPYGLLPALDAVVGRAITAGVPRWSVLAIEPRAAAVAAVRAMGRRLALALGAIVLVGIAAATMLAHGMARPLRTLTRATRDVATVTAPLRPIPVRSGDEIGELTIAFNRMAADLRRAHADLVAAARLASAGEIAAGIAHEVRTPLGILRGCAQMLGRSQRTDARERELADMIVSEVDRLERVVSGLTELARPRPPHVAATPLDPLLDRVAELVGPQAREAHVTVDVEHHPAPSTALCDAEQVYQVMLNLVVNALQAQPDGGAIRLRALGGTHGRVAFEVSDDGPGIATEDQPHVFEPFYARRQGGTGLGLALVARIVRAHDGAVSVASTPGRGATFRVELPAEAAA